LRTAPTYQMPSMEVDKECPRCGGSGREVLEGDSSSVKILCRQCVGIPSRDEEEDSKTAVEEVHEPAPDPNCGRCKGTGFTKYRSRGKDWEYRCRCWR
jgi:Zn finger protein HypA/HybF involved in hydrogenase expression